MSGSVKTTGVPSMDPEEPEQKRNYYRKRGYQKIGF
jgi:hypothetical protein